MLPPVSSEDTSGYITTTRVENIIYTIVSNKLVTYKELKSYNADEFLDIYEMTVVNVANKLMSMERSKKK